MFIDESKVNNIGYHLDSTSCHCGTDDSLYQSALYEQFFSSISKQYTLRREQQDPARAGPLRR